MYDLVNGVAQNNIYQHTTPKKIIRFTKFTPTYFQPKNKVGEFFGF